MTPTTNIVLSGLGGQGVLTASGILAQAAIIAGFDVKTSEVHGMSQRGGSVRSDVRFGPNLTRISPMVPEGGADYIVLLEDDQLPTVAHALSPKGIVVARAHINDIALPNPRSRNVAILGALSRHLTDRITAAHFAQAIARVLPAKLHEANLSAFSLGREHANFARSHTP